MPPVAFVHKFLEHTPSFHEYYIWQNDYKKHNFHKDIVHTYSITQNPLLNQGGGF
jgi:hypothetical protein